MAFNGSGLFQRLYSWVTDRDNGVKIQAQRMDDEMDGMTTGLSTCITKDGQTTVTANIPMNSKKFTGLADGTTAGDSVAYGQSQKQITIAPTASSAGQGLLVQQSGPTSGSTAGSVTTSSGGNPALIYNEIFISNEGADVTGASSPKFTYGSNVAMVTGGTNSTGSKAAQNVFLYKFSASAPASARDHIALNVGGLIDAGDGGTGTAANQSKGTMFAAGFGATARSGATNLFALSGAEVDIGIQTGASATYRLGWSVIDNGNLQAVVQDVGYEVGATAGAPGFKIGYMISGFHGGAGLSTDGTMFGTDGSAMTVANVLDVGTSTTISGYLLRSINASITGAGAASFVTMAVRGSSSGTTTVQAAATASGTLTFPAATDTLVGKATSDELTNKTITAAVGKGTWTASGTWTLPAFTLGGTVSGGGQQLNNVIIGTSTPLAGSFTTVTASGLVDISGAGAGQISFPATQNASAGANVLDDYEEGTWTPANSNVTITVAGANYTKIGRQVTVHFRVTWPSTANGSAAIITGLPFTCGAVAGSGVLGFNTSGTPATLLVDAGLTTIQIFNLTTAAGTALTNANLTTALLFGSVTYNV